METLTLVLVIILVVFIIAAAIIVAVNMVSGKNQKPTEIHFYGGANLDDGRISSDNNYFKGISGALIDTVLVDNNRISLSDSELSIALKSHIDGHTSNLRVNKQLILGRITEEGVFTINEKSVSRQHCMLSVKKGRLFLTDLNSSNNTYLNGKRVYHEVEVYSGDVIKAGNVELDIFFK